jgi:hypothetical protein
MDINSNMKSFKKHIETEDMGSFNVKFVADDKEDKTKEAQYVGEAYTIKRTLTAPGSYDENRLKGYYQHMLTNDIERGPGGLASTKNLRILVATLAPDKKEAERMAFLDAHHNPGTAVAVRYVDKTELITKTRWLIAAWAPA